MIEEFEYPHSEMPAPLMWRDPSIVHCDSGSCVGSTSSDRPDVAPENAGCPQDQPSAQAAEEAERNFAAGRTQGVEEGRQMERIEQSTRLRQIEEKKIQEVAQFAEQFAHERDSFLHALEPQVARLSISIASRILRREAQMDPLFLSGAVRVALGQLVETASVRLRVPSADAELWSETIAHLPNLRVKPIVIGDQEMRLGDCVLETDMGDADIGVHSQFAEITRGLLGDASSTNSHQALPADLEKTVSK